MASSVRRPLFERLKEQWRDGELELHEDDNLEPCLPYLVTMLQVKPSLSLPVCVYIAHIEHECYTLLV